MQTAARHDVLFSHKKLAARPHTFTAAHVDGGLPVNGAEHALDRDGRLADVREGHLRLRDAQRRQQDCE